MDFSDFSRSASEPPALSPLASPYSSPFGLDWLEREPPEFAQQRYQECRRRATKLVKAANKKALQRLGHAVEPLSGAAAAAAGLQPWPAQHHFQDHSLQGPQRKRAPRNFYKHQPLPEPVLVLPSPPKRSLSSAEVPTLSKLGDEGVGGEEGRAGGDGGAYVVSPRCHHLQYGKFPGLQGRGVARSLSAAEVPTLSKLGDAGSPKGTIAISLSSPGGKQKEAMTKLFDWGRCSHGSPYTFGQVFEEIDAKVQHRPVRDSRTTMGQLGPLQMGVGTSRAPRELPHLRRSVRASTGKGGDSTSTLLRRASAVDM